MTRTLQVAVVVVLAGTVLPPAAAWAQGAAAPQSVAPVGGNASPQAFLQAAKRALAAGHTSEAMVAMENAETLALNRSVPPSQANVPDQQPFVATVAAGRAALRDHDTAGALAKIDQAMAMPQAGG